MLRGDCEQFNLLAFNVDIFIKKSDWLESYEGTEVFDTDFEWISVVKLQMHVYVQTQVGLYGST